MRKRRFFAFAASVWLAVFALATTGTVHAVEVTRSRSQAVKFAVISDSHFYDTKLGTTGTAFEAYLAQDRKMLRESEAILDSAIKKIIAAHPKFLIVSGDLTKDGERSSHIKFAKKMNRLRSAGIKVFVCPGNHDINNPHALSYSGDTTTPVPNVSPEEFEKIYRNFGYHSPLDRDSASLSYLVEPVKGLWLLSIDSCKYENNETLGSPETSGAIRTETLSWIQQKLADAQTQGKTVIAFMHHGATEHYTGQSTAFPEYVVDDWKTVSKTLPDAGLRLIFTGHYHANDITRTVRTDGGPTLVDAETGSLVTYPSPIRFVSLLDEQASITTDYVTSIKYDTGGLAFPDYAQADLYKGLYGIAVYSLENSYGLNATAAAAYAPYVAKAFMAHYAGDEKITAEASAFIGSLLGSGNPTYIYLGQMLGSLWTDLAPADGSTVVGLANTP